MSCGRWHRHSAMISRTVVAFLETYFNNFWSFHVKQSFQGPHALAPLEMISTISTTEAARKVWGRWWWKFGVFFLLDNSTSSFSDELCDSDTTAIWTFMVGILSHLGPHRFLKSWFSVRLLKFSWVKLAFRTQPVILWDAVTFANGSSFRFYIQFCWEENPRSMKQWEVEHFWVDICGWFPDFRSSPLNALI